MRQHKIQRKKWKEKNSENEQNIRKFVFSDLGNPPNFLRHGLATSEKIGQTQQSKVNTEREGGESALCMPHHNPKCVPRRVMKGDTGKGRSQEETGKKNKAKGLFLGAAKLKE